MPEIAEAQALLAALAETDEVKAEAARRQRRAQLHVAYGNALIAARGLGAPETTEAFARAREQAHGDKDAPERLAADYGLCVGSLIRGELPSMRAHADGFPRETSRRDPIRPKPASRTALQGITHWFAGEYRRSAADISNARSPCSSPDATTTCRSGSDTTPASRRWPTWRLPRGLSAKSSGAISLVERDERADRGSSPTSNTLRIRRNARRDSSP